MSYIPNDTEQALQERSQRIHNYIQVFHQELQMLYRMGEKKRFHRYILGDIKTVKWLDYNRHDICFTFQLTYMDGTQMTMIYDVFIREHKNIAAWISNIYRWPLQYVKWKWTASYDVCLTPMEFYEMYMQNSNV